MDKIVHHSFQAGPLTWNLAGRKGAMVSIDLDTGAVTFGPNYDLDGAAREFWEAVGLRVPTRSERTFGVSRASENCPD
jgi:hypothetical protein